MNTTIRIGQIGFGQRGIELLKDCVLQRSNIQVAAICDVYEDRRNAAAQAVIDAGGLKPFVTDDWKKLVELRDLDCVLVTTGWAPHIEIACASMEAGHYTAVEVGGVCSIEDCWKLVRSYEKTGSEVMFLENCCYDRMELMVLNMVHLGLFGEVVHCQGGYRHDLREEITMGHINRHYRYEHFLLRNGDNYPTHDLGPIAHILDINRGNRMLTINSVASKSAGLHEYLVKKYGIDSPEAKLKWAQGDIVTSIIKCARGETITLTLDDCLPRPYSRGFHVQGTKAMYDEDTRIVWMDGDPEDFDISKHWGNAEEYYKKYKHPIWQVSEEEAAGHGHGGMDWIEFSQLFDAVANNKPVPIDVYDMASWLAITPLSEDSVAMGGAPVAIPDFTNGKWLTRGRWN